MINLILFGLLSRILPLENDLAIGLLTFVFIVLFGTVQWFLCTKVRHLAVRLIPVYYIILDLLLCLLFSFGVFGKVDFFLDFTSFFALIGVICDAVVSVGIAAGWIAYNIRNRGEKST